MTASFENREGMHGQNMERKNVMEGKQAQLNYGTGLLNGIGLNRGCLASRRKKGGKSEGPDRGQGLASPRDRISAPRNLVGCLRHPATTVPEGK